MKCCSMTCLELNLQVDELDSNLLSIEVRFYFPILQSFISAYNYITSLIHYYFLSQDIVSEIQHENTAFATTWGEIVGLVEDLVSDQDPQNEFYLDDPAKELYLGDPQNPENEFYIDGTHCELSRQYPLNKLYYTLMNQNISFTSETHK